MIKSIVVAYADERLLIISAFGVNKYDIKIINEVKVNFFNDNLGIIFKPNFLKKYRIGSTVIKEKWDNNDKTKNILDF